MTSLEEKINELTLNEMRYTSTYISMALESDNSTRELAKLETMNHIVSEQYDKQRIHMKNIKDLSNLWCVTLTSSEHIDCTSVQGPFESREIAEEFAKTWNQRRDEYIERAIEDDPDGDYEFNYIKAKAVELRFSPMNEKLLDEILNKETKRN